MKRKQRDCVKSHDMDDFIGVLLHNSFIELPGSNLQNFWESKDSLNSPGHAKQGDKNMLRNA